MLTLFVFDEQESRREEDLTGALRGLDDDAMVWIALRDPSQEEVAAVQEALGLDDEQARRLLEQPSQASLADHGEHLHVTLYVASSEEGEPALRPLECVLGANWVVTAHEEEIEVLEEFRERAERRQSGRCPRLAIVCRRGRRPRSSETFFGMSDMTLASSSSSSSSISSNARK